jgi:hypothetical protein
LIFSGEDDELKKLKLSGGKESPRRCLQGPVGVKNEGRSLFIFYNLKNI